jgi:glycosyl transferase family 1
VKIGRYCESIHSYENSMEMNASLKERLSIDNFPVLVEGNFCSEISALSNVKDRKVLIRLHDTDLRKFESQPGGQSFLEKFLRVHSPKSNRTDFQRNHLYICISEKKAETLREQYHLTNVEWLPLFVSWHKVRSEEGKGSFCLYHGNLSSAANEKTARWLLEKVFSVVRYPFIIAGKSPTRGLYKLAQLYSHSHIIADPAENEIDDLIQKAHINIVPCMQASGGKYKLLHSLFLGKHCLTNCTMIGDTGLEKACHIANDKQSKIEAIENLVHIPFTSAEIELRKNLLSGYNNSENIRKLIDWLYC